MTRPPIWVQAVSRLDRARGAVLLAAMHVPLLAAIGRRRDSRVLARSIVGIATAFVASVLVPGGLYMLSPLVLGVAHIGADLRYLVRRQQMSPRVEAFFYGGCAALLALRAAEALAPTLPYPRLELAAAGAWILSASLLGMQGPASRARAAGIAVGVMGVLVVAWPRPAMARVLFAHVHNVVAVVVWLALFFRRRRAAAVPATILAGALLLILRGFTLPYFFRFGHHDAFRSQIFDAVDQLAPLLPFRLGVSVVLSYVFLQSVHYMVWLSWVPESAIRTQGTLTFRMTARGLRRDFGASGLAVIASAGLVVLGAAFFDAPGARAAYLSLSGFHGYLELAVLAFLAARGHTRSSPVTASA